MFNLVFIRQAILGYSGNKKKENPSEKKKTPCKLPNATLYIFMPICVLGHPSISSQKMTFC